MSYRSAQTSQQGYELVSTSSRGTAMRPVSGLVHVQAEADTVYSIVDQQSFRTVEVATFEKNATDLLLFLPDGKVVILTEFFLNTIPGDYSSKTEVIGVTFPFSASYNDEADQFEWADLEDVTFAQAFNEEAEEEAEEEEEEEEERFHWGHFAIGAGAGVLGGMLLTSLLSPNSSGAMINNVLDEDDHSASGADSELSSLKTAIGSLSDKIDGLTDTDASNGGDNANNGDDNNEPIIEAIESLESSVSDGLSRLSEVNADAESPDWLSIDAKIEALTDAFELQSAGQEATSNSSDNNITINNYNDAQSDFADDPQDEFEGTKPSAPTLTFGDGELLVQADPNKRLTIFNSQTDADITSRFNIDEDDGSYVATPKKGAFYQETIGVYATASDESGVASDKSDVLQVSFNNPLKVESISIESIEPFSTNNTLKEGDKILITLKYDGEIKINGDPDGLFLTLTNGGTATYTSHSLNKITFQYEVKQNDTQIEGGLDITSFGGDTTASIVSKNHSVPVSDSLQNSVNALTDMDLSVNIRPFVQAVSADVSIDENRPIDPNGENTPITGTITLKLSEPVKFEPTTAGPSIADEVQLYIEQVISIDGKPTVALFPDQIIGFTDTLEFSLSENAYIDSSNIQNQKVNLDLINIIGIGDDGYVISDPTGEELRAVSGGYARGMDDKYTKINPPAAGYFVSDEGGAVGSAFDLEASFDQFDDTDEYTLSFPNDDYIFSNEGSFSDTKKFVGDELNIGVENVNLLVEETPNNEWEFG